MSQWFNLYRKEMIEMWRNSKWLWVPVVFVILGVMNPAASYFMPELIKNMGGLPEGAVIQIPPPTGAEVMVKTLSQYSLLGVLILVLSSMGVVAAERSGGVAALIMVKPVPHASYISAKWAGLITLTAASFFLGYAATWYYTEVLIGSIEPARILQSGLVYALWLAFILTLTLFMSTWLKTGGAIAFLAILSAAALSVLTGLFPAYMKWSPARLSDIAGAYLITGKGLPQSVFSIIVTAAGIALLIAASAYVFKTREISE